MKHTLKTLGIAGMTALTMACGNDYVSPDAHAYRYNDMEVATFPEPGNPEDVRMAVRDGENHIVFTYSPELEVVFHGMQLGNTNDRLLRLMHPDSAQAIYDMRPVQTEGCSIPSGYQHMASMSPEVTQARRNVVSQLRNICEVVSE